MAFCLKTMHFAFVSIVLKLWKTVGTLRVNQESRDLAFIRSTYIFSSIHHIFSLKCITLMKAEACYYHRAPTLLHYFANIKPSVLAANSKDFLHNNKNVQRNEDASQRNKIFRAHVCNCKTRAEKTIPGCSWHLSRLRTVELVSLTVSVSQSAPSSGHRSPSCDAGCV